MQLVAGDPVTVGLRNRLRPWLRFFYRLVRVFLLIFVVVLRFFLFLLGGEVFAVLTTQEDEAIVVEDGFAEIPAADVAPAFFVLLVFVFVLDRKVNV